MEEVRGRRGLVWFGVLLSFDLRSLQAAAAAAYAFGAQLTKPKPQTEAPPQTQIAWHIQFLYV